MSEAARWAAHEIGCSFSQSCGNINVPETALSNLISERDRLRAENARLSKTLELRTLELHAVIATARNVEERHKQALEKARVALHSVVHGPEQAWNSWLACRDDALRHIDEVLK